MAGCALAPTSAIAEESKALGYDPRAAAEGLVRLQGSLDPAAKTPWWYEAVLYAVVEGQVPRLMVRAEGCETYVMRREPGGGFRARGATVTAFKSVDGESWIDQLENPITGQTNIVKTNVLQGASAIYPPDGAVPYMDSSRLQPSQLVGAPTASPKSAQSAGWLKWIESGDRIGCLMERRSTGPIQPYMETASLWTTRREFFDPKLDRVDATFTSTFLSPWLAWMEMAAQPGHLLWHSTGRKLRSLSDLPDGYRRRAEQLAPGKLASNPFDQA
jgi:hypothetical protein